MGLPRPFLFPVARFDGLDDHQQRAAERQPEPPFIFQLLAPSSFRDHRLIVRVLSPGLGFTLQPPRAVGCGIVDRPAPVHC